MGENIIDWSMLRSKLKSTGQGLYKNTKTKVINLGKKVKDTTGNGKTKVINILLKKGISITEKQLNILKDVKERSVKNH